MQAFVKRKIYRMDYIIPHYFEKYSNFYGMYLILFVFRFRFYMFTLIGDIP